MSTPVSDARIGLVAAILRATADLAAARVAYAQNVAERHGLAATDVEVLRLLASEGAMTVGRVGELTALTTGATTRLIDRLEQAGFVRRLPDPADRRRVIVEAAPDRATAVQQAFDPVDEAATLALGSLDAAALAGVHAYLTACVAALRATPSGDAGAPAADATGSVGAPIAAATSGRLVFVTGAPNVTISGSRDLGGELYRARFKGAIPSARVRDGLITIRYPRFAWFDWRARVAGEFVNASAHWKRVTTEMQLNATLAWEIELRGGATNLTADVRSLNLTGLEVAGGAGSMSLRLGVPTGRVPIRLAGSVNDIKIARPEGVAVTFRLKGGYREATLDGVEAWSPGQIATPRADTAADRFEIVIAGGVNRVTVRGE
jgi:DNA-binding MarR family transcriptional regulator